jgi:P-type Cu+ transporter
LLSLLNVKAIRGGYFSGYYYRMAITKEILQQLRCFHCGETCPNKNIALQEKYFCCQGCKMVYQILNESGLCEYYSLNENPGVSQKIDIRKDKFAFLDDDKVQEQLIRFKDDTQVHVTFYLPQIHCSSCLYLLENLHHIDKGIISCKINFTQKEADVVFLSAKTSLRNVVETLTAIGYEPYISLHDSHKKRPAIDKSLVYQVGLSAFCFSNIMLLSFPEYLGIDASEAVLLKLFRWVSFGLAIPVLVYAALPFYISSWKSLKHKYLNIDAPIALAIIITFIRSAYEVISGTGSGYFDSMSGIVFFMLAGRILQEKTFQQLSFERDYTSYFPIAVTVIKDEKEMPMQLSAIKPGDTLLIHNAELIPADGILTRGNAFIDYSFVTGESVPILKEMGELVYAGGKQTGSTIEILVIKEVAQSYLTKLWNKNEVSNTASYKPASFVNIISKWFTFFVFGIAMVTAVYWQFNNQAKLWTAVTAIFIIACPCALLLSNSFTNGNIIRILSRNKFYVRNAQVIEDMAATRHIVFDKTGTLTQTLQQDIIYEGRTLTSEEQQQVATLATCSSHPLSKVLAAFLKKDNCFVVQAFKETIGEGIEGFVNGEWIKIGSSSFVNNTKQYLKGTLVYVMIENETVGFFRFSSGYRENISGLFAKLRRRYKLSVLSGDNDAEKENLQKILGTTTTALFNQKPDDKLNYIKHLQQHGENVIMIGDGLNDAVALKQSNVGIAVCEQANNFTPASHAIIQAAQLPLLNKFITLCKANRNIITASFILSIVYNIIGLFFAVQGTLSPLIAAILMPSSSLSILLLTFGSSNFIAMRLGLPTGSKTI